MQELLNAYEYMQQLFATFLGDVIVAAIILIIGFVIGRIAERFISKVLHGIEADKVLKKVAGVKFSLESLISHLVSYFIYFLAIVMALNKIGLTTTVLNILTSGAVILIILAVLLAIKDFIPNAFAGFFVYYKKLFEIGNNIKVKDVQGKVIAINLLETQLKTKRGDIIHVPNSSLLKNEIIVKKK